MRRKTSITLSDATLAALAELSSEGVSKSRIIELAVADLLERRRRMRRDAADREILDSSADRLNEEIGDILGYQIEP